MAPCSPHLDLPCFDLDRCSSSATAPIKVYLHQHNATTTNETRSIRVIERGLKRAQENMPDVVQLTNNHSEACLFLVARGSFPSHHEMIHHPLYMAGQNHVILNSNLLMGSRGDHPFPYHFNYELAALMAPTLEAGYLRPGYDQVLHLPSVWRRPHKYDSLQLHRPRRLLLSFKGKVLIKNPVPYQAYRWLAAEYWHNESSSDVYVDVHCGDGYLGYELEGLEAYGELLLNSTFVFAPGGNGQSSYRFTEALNADAIPVVMSYVSLPFEPEIDWSGCVVRVAEARIPNVPHLLRSMSVEEVRARRERCRVLYRGVIGREREEEGWTSQPYAKTPLLTALKIWKIRILTAKARQEALRDLE